MSFFLVNHGPCDGKLTAYVKQGMQVLGTMVIIALNAPMVLPVFIPLGYVYRLVMRYYLATSRELKRLDAVSRSPIFSFFGETLAGLPVIRVSPLLSQTR